jgi:hypothetical protein
LVYSTDIRSAIELGTIDYLSRFFLQGDYLLRRSTIHRTPPLPGAEQDKNIRGGGGNYKLEGWNFFLIIFIKYLQGRGIFLQGLGPLPALSPSATALFCSILYTYTLCHALKLLTVFKNGIVFFKNLNLFF